MSNASNYLEEQIGTHLLRTNSWTKPSAIYVALFTVMPTESGTGGTEVTGGSYTRFRHGPSDAKWTAPDVNGNFSNIGPIVFPYPTDDWGSIVGYGLYDAETGGNYLAGNTLPTPVVIYSYDPAPVWYEGEMVVTIS